MSIYKLYFSKAERKPSCKTTEQIKSHRIIKYADLNISVSCFNYSHVLNTLDSFYNHLSYIFLHHFLPCIFYTQAYKVFIFMLLPLKIVYKSDFLKISQDFFDILMEKATGTKA